MLSACKVEGQLANVLRLDPKIPRHVKWLNEIFSAYAKRYDPALGRLVTSAATLSENPVLPKLGKEYILRSGIRYLDKLCYNLSSHSVGVPAATTPKIQQNSPSICAARLLTNFMAQAVQWCCIICNCGLTGLFDTMNVCSQRRTCTSKILI